MGTGAVDKPNCGTKITVVLSLAIHTYILANISVHSFSGDKKYIV
jgi:hypothetical protein